MARYTWQPHSCSTLIYSLIRKGTCVMLRDNDNNDRRYGDARHCENASCNRYCCKRCCPVCPPEQRSCNLSGIQAQLHGAARALLENNSNVVFDKMINQSNPNIQYDDFTGEFILPPNRSYYVSWEAAVDGSETVQSIDFCVVVNNAMISVSSSSQVTCQMSGTALITTGKTPGRLSLMNVSGDTVRYTAALVQANIVIAGITC